MLLLLFIWIIFFTFKFLIYLEFEWHQEMDGVLSFSISLFQYCFFSSVHFSRVWLLATPWITVCQASLSITNSHSSLKLMSIEPVVPSSHPILCRPLLLLPPIPPSVKVFSNESTLRIRWPKYWSFGLAPVLPMTTQDWSPLEWTGWISLKSKGLSRVFSNTTVQSINSSVLSFLHSPTLTSICDHRKNHSLD